jgi:uncharacterized protein involved in cysteine biosynthesis
LITPVLAHGGEAILLIVTLFVAIVLAEMAVAIVVAVVADLLIGTGLLLVLKKKRYLFWTLPTLNVAAWFFMGSPFVWLRSGSEGQNDFNWVLDLVNWLMVPLLLVVGLMTAGMLASVQMAVGRVARRRDDDTATGVPSSEATMTDTTGQTPEVLATDRYDSDSMTRPAAVGHWPSFREGFLAPWDGLAFMCRHRELWKYGVIPILLNIVISGVVLVVLLVVAGLAIDRLHPMFPAGWGWLTLEIISGIAIAALAILGAFVSWLLLEAILCGFFYGKLAVQVELKLGMPRDEMRDVSLMAQTVDAIRDITLLLSINIGLLALHIVPVIGSLVAICGSTYFNLMILGGDFVAFPLDLRGMRRAEKKAYAKQFRYHTLGLGAAVILLILVPVVGAVLLTTAVTGSVLLHRRQQAPAQL